MIYILSQEFKSIRKLLKISFLSALHKKSKSILTWIFLTMCSAHGTWCALRAWCFLRKWCALRAWNKKHISSLRQKGATSLCEAYHHFGKAETSLLFLSHPVHCVTLFPFSTASKKYQYFKAIAFTQPPFICIIIKYSTLNFCCFWFPNNQL